MWVLLPVKDLHTCKSRLADALPLSARQSLMSALLQDLLRTLGQCQLVTGVTVVTRCPAATALATRYQANSLNLPEDQGLNEAVSAGVRFLAHANEPAALVMHADLPFVTASDIDHLIKAHREAGVDVSLVPDNREDGTNALLLNLPSTMTFRYGRQSFDAHRQAAQALQLRCQSLQNSRVGSDIDLWEDVQPLGTARDQLTPGELTTWLSQHAHLFAIPRAANL